MKWIKLFEENSESKLEQIKDIIKENQFLSKYADQITEKSLKEFNDYIYVELPNELDSAHINKHFDKNNPGSIWSISKEEVSKVITETLDKKPTKALQEGPTFKYKWLNLEYSKPVGFDSLKKVEGDIKKEVDLEPFGMTERVKEWEKVDGVAKQNGYELVAKEGDETREYTEEDLKNNVPCFIKQEVGVIEGDKMQNLTKTYNLITAKVGEVDGKSVLTLMTVFPGVNPVDKDGKDITNKKDLADAGYALIKSKKTNESIKLKYLMTFESFKMNENSQELEEDIFDYECTKGDPNYDKWEEGEEDMSNGLVRGDYDLYEQGYKKKAEVLTAVGYSEDDVDRWCESKADSFDAY